MGIDLGTELEPPLGNYRVPLNFQLDMPTKTIEAIQFIILSFFGQMADSPSWAGL